MKVASRLLSMLVCAAVLSPTLALAASTSTPPKDRNPGGKTEPLQGVVAPSPALTPGGPLKSCFDYYQFGSVQVALNSELQSVTAGAPVAFTADIKNTNKYPVVDTTIYIKIFHQTGPNGQGVNGPDVVDFFPIAKNITLKAGEVKKLTFIWNAPQDIDPGSYRITSYVVQDDRFNFEGLTFTEDVTGGFYNFSVINTTHGAVRFNRSTALMVGQQYRFVAYAPEVGQNISNVPVALEIDNTKNVSYSGDVIWKTYVWDGLRESTLLDTTKQKVGLSPNASTTVSYVVKDMNHSVYYVTAELITPKGSKSIAAFRFVRGGVIEPRLSSVDVTGYPLGKDSVAFACFHSTGYGNALDTRVDLSVKALLPVIGDALSFLPFAHTSYSGIAPGNLVAITLPVTHTSDSFELVAKIYQKNKLIDSVTVPYTCEALGSKCSNTSLILIIASILALLVLAFLIWRTIQKRKKLTEYSAPEHRSMTPPPSTPI